MKERFETFTVLITSVSRSIHRIKTEEMAEYHLRSSHVSCLYYLYKEGALTATELCDICEEDKANISRCVKYLEANGYLEARDTKGKRYQAPLALTEKGREVAGGIACKIDGILKVSAAGLTEDELRIMYKALKTISVNLQSKCEEYENK